MTERLLTYYGDDFTGSTDALEALAANGIPSVLFLSAPTEAQLERFADCQAIGVAGESRSQPPEWMSARLPHVFKKLKSLGAPVCQYKVCSTFDSSPERGSIGCAMEIGKSVFGSPYVPIVVAAPHLKRFVLFGNLFAAAGGAVYRIDRHPVMRHHPVTPMGESDLRLHLRRQTDLRIELLDILALHGGAPDTALRQLAEKHPGAVLFDGLDSASLLEAGRLLWTCAPALQTFAVGSAGLNYALIEYWRSAGVISAGPDPGNLQPADRIIVLSGSCSPITENQIRAAIASGFHAIRVRPRRRESLLLESLAALKDGRSVILYSALGPADCNGELTGAGLGCYLGEILRDLLTESGVRRAVIAGGDTASYSARQLGIEALTYVAQLAPGAPLCRAESGDSGIDGIDLVLKGGQVGPNGFFEKVLRGEG